MSSEFVTVSRGKDEEHHHDVSVHTEVSPDLDFDHASALDLPLRQCTDEMLITEIARRYGIHKFQQIIHTSNIAINLSTII